MRNVLIFLSLFILSCGSDSARVDDIQSIDGDAQAGQAIYSANCERCHGPAGAGTSLGSSITGSGEQKIIKTTLSGDGSMPSFSSLSDQEIADCTAFVLSL